VDESVPLSVHLVAWPEYDVQVIDEKLNREMSLVVKLASIGHAARNKANRKVRQPLSEAAFSVGSVEERRIVAAYAELLEDELNVKSVRSLDTAGEAVSYSLNPLPKQLGQKYGSRFPAIRAAVLAADVEKAARTILAGQPLELKVGEDTLSILPEEVEVRAQARAGYAVASEGAYLAALVTDLTPELEKEGLVREFVRRVQDLRKQADLDIADRIRVYYVASPRLQDSVQAFRDYVMGETLAVELHAREVPAGFTSIEDQFDGEKVKVGLEKASKA
jgi:isoleucyl-tRNA synthetase